MEGVGGCSVCSGGCALMRGTGDRGLEGDGLGLRETCFQEPGSRVPSGGVDWSGVVVPV